MSKRKKDEEKPFMDEFTEEMIKASKELNKKPPLVIKKIEPQISAPQPIQMPVVKPALPAKPLAMQKSIMSMQTPKPAQATKPIPIQNITQKPMPAQTPQQRPVQQTKAPPQKDDKRTGIEKIDRFLKDALVTSVECPGGDKNVLIKKAGSIIKTEVILSRDNILQIITYFAEKARIPIVEGMLLARVENLEISAVIPSTNSASPSIIIRKEPIPNMAQKPTTNLMHQSMPITPLQPKPQIPFVPRINPNNPPLKKV